MLKVIIKLKKIIHIFFNLTHELNHLLIMQIYNYFINKKK